MIPDTQLRRTLGSNAKVGGRLDSASEGKCTNQRHRASRPAWKNLLRDRTPTLPIADMRQVVAAIDDRPRYSGGGCILGNQTPRPAAVASPMGH
jgi:hypothetical protein